jgi:hypothetical protein
VSRRALNLMEDILCPYYKCTISSVIHKLNISGHMLIRKFFLVWVCGSRAQCLSYTLTLYIATSCFLSIIRSFGIISFFYLSSSLTSRLKHSMQYVTDDTQRPGRLLEETSCVCLHLANGCTRKTRFSIKLQMQSIL